MEERKNYFADLNAVNVNGHTEQKNGLTYLSWAWAWAEVKKRFPDATYTIYERGSDYGPCCYFTDGRTCWVKTGVTICGLEHIEYLPVMDFRNKSIPLESVTSMDINKAIQRSLTKACARHGLGLYIYAGEDLPEEETKADDPPIDTERKATRAQVQTIAEKMPEDRIAKMLGFYGVSRIEDLTSKQAGEVMVKMKKEGLI